MPPYRVDTVLDGADEFDERLDGSARTHWGVRHLHQIEFLTLLQSPVFAKSYDEYMEQETEGFQYDSDEDSYRDYVAYHMVGISDYDNPLMTEEEVEAFFSNWDLFEKGGEGYELLKLLHVEDKQDHMSWS